MYYILGGILCCYGMIGIIRPSLMRQQIALVYYGMTAIVLGIFEYIHWEPMFVVRYFFYIISILMMVLVPIILLLLAILAILDNRGKYQRVSYFTRFLQTMISFSFFLFLGYTLWALRAETHFLYARFISVYTEIGIYFTLSFLVYVVLTCLINCLPIAKAYDLVVILGTEIGDEGQILKTLQLRLDCAVRYFYQCSQQERSKLRLLVAGGATQQHRDLTEADQMKAYLIAQGIPSSQIWLERLSKNTYENFVYSKLIMAQQGYKTVPLVISSKFHLLRARHLAYMTHFKGRFRGARVPWYLWPYSLVREYLAFLHLTKELNYCFLLVILIRGMIHVLNIF